MDGGVKCTHSLADMDTAAHFDGLCPLCLQTEVERLKGALTAVDGMYKDEIERLRAQLNNTIS